MLEDVYASSDANIVMMFFELFYSEKFLGGMPPDPLQLCRHYGFPLTKILATPLRRLLNQKVTTLFTLAEPFIAKNVSQLVASTCM